MLRLALNIIFLKFFRVPKPSEKSRILKTDYTITRLTALCSSESSENRSNAPFPQRKPLCNSQYGGGAYPKLVLFEND